MPSFMADPSTSPCIVWFRDDLRLSDHPALHAAAEAARAGDLPLRARRDRSPSARPLGGATRWWLAQSLRALAGEPPPLGLDRWCCARGRRPTSFRRWRPRPGPVPSTGTRSPRRRIRPLPNRLKRRSQGSPSARTASPAISWRSLPTYAAKRAVACGSSPRSGGDCWPQGARRSRCRRRGASRPVAGTSPARPSRAGASSPRQPDWAGGLRESWSAGREAARTGSRRSWTMAWTAIPASATGRTATAPPACRRICASARSARARSGTPLMLLPQPSTRPSGDIDKFLSELGWREFCLQPAVRPCPDLRDAATAAAVRGLPLEARRQRR